MRGLTGLLAAALVFAATAGAAWGPSGTGVALSKAASMPTGAAPQASVSGLVTKTVTLRWDASAFSTGVTVSGYRVTRYPAGGGAGTIVCGGQVSGTQCTDAGLLPLQSYAYAVTPVQANWTGTESPRTAVTT